MKDELISISNELLDDATELNSNQIEKLRKDRLQLIKQVKQLEKYLRYVSVDDEGCKSKFSSYAVLSSRPYKYGRVSLNNNLVNSDPLLKPICLPPDAWWTLNDVCCTETMMDAKLLRHNPSAAILHN
ncbi:DNA helicase, ATP-dependent, RecQ type [Artemisia annua]|uniref:DNA helicase, ATP-dependent, RecQ type n=1 Tax=Artemisia annua TaxID=35608 RepID=A0A2U1MQN2_ARTAN|nr:DNA helicase, ATP-dependent, RecQ type [Artemisia annua]